LRQQEAIPVPNDNQHHHHHEHGHHDHGHSHLGWALVFTLAFAVVEAGGGWWSGSLALLSDAGHMVTDAFSLALAAFAAWIAKRPPSARHTYGLVRAEIIAALVNGLLMLGVVAFIVIEAIERLRNPQPVAGGWVMLIAALGFAVNAVVAWVLSHGREGLNTRAALLHVLGDLLGSAAALLAGAIIYFTGWTAADPILSLLVVALILVSTVRLLKEALHVLMEGVPPSLDLEEVGRAMAGVAGVTSVHDLHIWTLSSGQTALSAHVDMGNLSAWPAVLAATRTLLHDRFDIDHVTLQPEVMLPPREGVVVSIQPRRAQ
jgi:cobalt-zinc-cadmium efflux system protein